MPKPPAAAEKLKPATKALLTRKEAAAWCGLATSTIAYAERTGALRGIVSDKPRGATLFRVSDLESWRARVGQHSDSMRTALDAILRGCSPIDLVMKHGLLPERARQLIQTMAELSGGWYVEGPPGSREAWMRAHRIDVITPEVLRRALELFASIPWLRAFIEGRSPYAERSYYIAASHCEHERVRVLQAAALLDELGYRPTMPWWDLSRDFYIEYPHARDAARECLSSLRSAEIVVLIEPHDAPRTTATRPHARNAYAELGVLLERMHWSGQRVLIVAEHSETFFFEVPGCTRVPNLEALRAALSVRPHSHQETALHDDDDGQRAVAS